MFHSMLRDRRGVSEVIASLILILIVSIAGVVLYSYSLGAFNMSSSYFLLQTRLEEEKVRERFQIAATWWDMASQLLNLTIFNHGKIETVVDAIYINGTKVSDFLSGRGVAIGPRELLSVKFNAPVTIQSGQKYEILMVTERGSKNAVYWKA